MSNYDEMSFEELLNRGSKEIPVIRPLPDGTWEWKLGAKPKAMPKTKADGRDSVMFVFQAVGPTDDVNEEDIAALGANYDVKANRVFYRAWLGDGRDWDNLRNLLIMLGAEKDFESFPEAFEQAKGGSVYAATKTRYYTTDSGEERADNELSNFQPVE